MSTPSTTLAQLANQGLAIVGVSISFFDRVGVASESLVENQLRMHLLRRIIGLSLRAAGIPVRTATVLGQSQFVASQVWHEQECVLAFIIGETPVKQAIEAMRSELQAVFMTAGLLEKFIGLGHFDWFEARWIRDFPPGKPQPFAPWLDYLGHLRTTGTPKALDPDVARLFGYTDV